MYADGQYAAFIWFDSFFFLLLLALIIFFCTMHNTLVLRWMTELCWLLSLSSDSFVSLWPYFFTQFFLYLQVCLIFFCCYTNKGECFAFSNRIYYKKVMSEIFCSKRFMAQTHEQYSDILIFKHFVLVSFWKLRCGNGMFVYQCFSLHYILEALKGKFLEKCDRRCSCYVPKTTAYSYWILLFRPDNHSYSCECQ